MSFSKEQKNSALNLLIEYEAKSIYSPTDGTVIPLESVPDEVFASKALGDGVAIYPNTGNLYSPVNGKVSTLFSTKHALGIISVDGMEILLHIGIDTVTMDGDGFESYINIGEEVKAGQLLIKFDISKIKNYGLNPCVMVIVTNLQAVGEIVIEERDKVNFLQKIVSVK